MNYGQRALSLGCKGPDVAELQLRLAGFLGTEPHGDFDETTKLQVTTFQQDVLGMQPTGIVDRRTMQGIDAFGAQHPFDFAQLRCPCGKCQGFGQGRGMGVYSGTPGDEKGYQYEYPGMHRMLLWAVRALYHYMSDYRFTVNSGYRCRDSNAMHGRDTTNHHGKAIDLGVDLAPGESAFTSQSAPNVARAVLQATAHAQIGWSHLNQKALEPASIAPTWVHYDVRCYERKYLGDEMFCTTLAQLDGRMPVSF